MNEKQQVWIVYSSKAFTGQQLCVVANVETVQQAIDKAIERGKFNQQDAPYLQAECQELIV